MTPRDIVLLIIKVLSYALAESRKCLRDDDLAQLASDSVKEKEEA